MEQEILYHNPEPANGRVSDVEVESVMKMLMAYQKARAEGVGQPNPELDVNTISLLTPLCCFRCTIMHMDAHHIITCSILNIEI